MADERTSFDAPDLARRLKLVVKDLTSAAQPILVMGAKHVEVRVAVPCCDGAPVGMPFYGERDDAGCLYITFVYQTCPSYLRRVMTPLRFCPCCGAPVEVLA